MKIYTELGSIDVGEMKERCKESKTISGGWIPHEEFYNGNTCIVLKKGVFEEHFPSLAKRYPNRFMTMKIYVNRPQIKEEDTLLIQNIGWMRRLAPRVYEDIELETDTDSKEPVTGFIMDLVDDKHPPEKHAHELWDVYERIFADYGITTTMNDANQANFHGVHLVDFGAFFFKDKEKYLADVKERFEKTAYWGSKSNSYQTINHLKVDGSRTYDRFERLGMNKLKLEGKTVLDIGCSGGQTLYWALDRGAERVVGVDTPEIAEVTFEMANAHGYPRVETFGWDLKEEGLQKALRHAVKLDRFDIVVMFSVNAHIGFHPYMRTLCKDTMYLETNAAKMPDIERKEYPTELKKLGYNSFQYRGQVDESGGRSLFICK